MKHILVVLSVLMVLLNLAGCSKKDDGVEKSEFITITDCAGREVTVSGNIERIVDLQLDGTRTLIQLGEEDKLVGLTDRGLESFKASESGGNRFKWTLVSKVAPQLQNLPSVGSFKEPNVETIISLKPDVIFAPVSIKDKAGVLEDQTGIPVICMSNFASLDFKMLRIVGTLTGKEDRAEELISYSENLIKNITGVISQIPEDEKVDVFIVTPPTDFSGNSFKTMSVYKPIDLAGGMNLAGKADIKAATWETSKEQIAVWNPDLIFIYASFNAGKEGFLNENVAGINNIISDPILKITNAAKTGSVYTYMGWDYGWDPATGVIQVPYMAKLFYPEKFKMLNVEKTGNEILEKFYGIDDLYSEMMEKHDLFNWVFSE